MARAAGDTGTYDFVLRRKDSGKYDLDCKLEFDSVTTVISAVLAKPFLVGWAFNYALEVVKVIVDKDREGHLSWSPDPNEGLVDVLELLSSPDDLDEFIKENRLHHKDVKNDAADRGKEEHVHLETLANLALDEDHQAADDVARRWLASEKSTGYRRATAAWWLDHEPKVVASEAFLLSKQHWFAGTCDLITEGEVIDLKSRRAGLGMYDSDDIQTGAYEIALEEQTGIVRSRYVLVIHEDGTYDYEDAKIDQTAFLDLLQVYRKLKGGK